MPRVAWFSAVSLSPPTRAAVFTRTFLAQRPKNWEIEIFVDDLGWKMCCRECSGSKFICGYPFFHYLQAFLRDFKKPFDYYIYHCENTMESAFVNDVFHAKPGIVYCHDFEHFCASDLGQHNADNLFVVSHEYAVAPIQAKLPGCHIAWSPFPLLPRTKTQVQQHRKMQRQKLGWKDSDKVITVATATRIMPREDRLYQLSAALQLLVQRLATAPLPEETRNKSPNVYLLWIVNTTQDEHAVQDFRERFLVLDKNTNIFSKQNIVIQKAQTLEELTALIDASDIVSCLNSNFFRGISLGTMLALAGGIPTIAGHSGFGLELPPSVAMKVHLGMGEQEALQKTFEEIFRNVPLQEALCQGSQDYVELLCNPVSVVADLEGLIERHESFLRARSVQQWNSYQSTQQQLIWQMEKELHDKDIGDVFIGERPLLDLCGQFSRKAVSDFGWSAVY